MSLGETVQPHTHLGYGIGVDGVRLVLLAGTLEFGEHSSRRHHIGLDEMIQVDVVFAVVFHFYCLFFSHFNAIISTHKKTNLSLHAESFLICCRNAQLVHFHYTTHTLFLIEFLRFFPLLTLLPLGFVLFRAENFSSLSRVGVNVSKQKKKKLSRLSALSFNNSKSSASRFDC